MEVLLRNAARGRVLSMDEKLTASSLAEIKKDSSLRWEVQGSNWKYVGDIIDLDDEIESVRDQLNSLSHRIGHAVIDDREPNLENVNEAQELKKRLKQLHGQLTHAREQTRAAMHEKLVQMLAPDEVEQIPDKELDAFFDELTKSSCESLSLYRGSEEWNQECKRKGI